MTPTPELEAAVERLKEALDDFDRDLADVIDDEAFNVGQDESIEVSTADLRLVLASLPTGDIASRDHAPGEQRQGEGEEAGPVGHDGYGDCGGTGWVWVSDGDQSNFYEGGSCWRCRPRAATQSLPTGTGEGEWHPAATAPHACHVHACRFDPDAGEWVHAIVLSPPTRPFTHWRPLPPPPHQPGA